MAEPAPRTITLPGDLPATAPGTNVEWTTGAALGTAAIRLELADLAPDARCDVSVLLTGLYGEAGIFSMHWLDRNGTTQWRGGGSHGAFGLQVGEYDIWHDAEGVAFPRPGPEPRYSTGIHIPKKHWENYTLSGDVAFSVAGTNVRPIPDSESVSGLGNASARIAVHCDRPVEARLLASRQVLLATPATWDSALHVGLLAADATYRGETRRDFAGRSVQIVGAFAGAFANPVLPPRLSVTHRDGEERWELDGRGTFNWTGAPGPYGFTLDRSGALGFGGIGPNCSPQVCISDSRFYLAAVGWHEIPDLDAAASLPDFA